MNEYLIILSTLIACAFFSGLEIAFLTSNKLKIELDNNQGVLSGRIFSRFVKKPSSFISTTLLGNCVAIVVYGIYSEELLEPYAEMLTANHILVFLIKTMVSTVFILFTAEFIPKTLFSINPNRALKLFAVPFITIYYLLYPVVYLTIGITELILKLFGSGEHHERKAFGKIDLDNYVDSFSHNNEENQKIDHEIEIFQNALEFGEVKARDCMIPRPEIVALEVDDSIDELKAKFTETGLSKILIYRNSIDNIIGYIHSSELFTYPETIKSIILPILIVPETMSANEVLQQLIQDRKSVAIVMDEFGGTSGMLTMEDIMEEIFGDIDDEHDSEDHAEQQISDTEFMFAGRLEIDYINQKYNLNLPELEDYKTLAGLIIHQHEGIPKKNQIIKVEDNFVFTIISATPKRIDQVKLKIEK